MRLCSLVVGGVGMVSVGRTREDHCSAVGGGSCRSGASEEILAATICRGRLDRLLAQLRD